MFPPNSGPSCRPGISRSASSQGNFSVGSRRSLAETNPESGFREGNAGVDVPNESRMRLGSVWPDVSMATDYDKQPYDRNPTAPVGLMRSVQSCFDELFETIFPGPPEPPDAGMTHISRHPSTSPFLMPVVDSPPIRKQITFGVENIRDNISSSRSQRNCSSPILSDSQLINTPHDFRAPHSTPKQSMVSRRGSPVYFPLDSDVDPRPIPEYSYRMREGTSSANSKENSVANTSHPGRFQHVPFSPYGNRSQPASFHASFSREYHANDASHPSKRNSTSRNDNAQIRNTFLNGFQLYRNTESHSKSFIQPYVEPVSQPITGFAVDSGFYAMKSDEPEASDCPKTAVSILESQRCEKSTLAPLLKLEPYEASTTPASSEVRPGPGNESKFNSTQHTPIFSSISNGENYSRSRAIPDSKCKCKAREVCALATHCDKSIDELKFEEKRRMEGENNIVQNEVRKRLSMKIRESGRGKKLRREYEGLPNEHASRKKFHDNNFVKHKPFRHSKTEHLKSGDSSYSFDDNASTSSGNSTVKRIKKIDYSCSGQHYDDDDYNDFKDDDSENPERRIDFSRERDIKCLYYDSKRRIKKAKREKRRKLLPRVRSPNGDEENLNSKKSKSPSKVFTDSKEKSESEKTPLNLVESEKSNKSLTIKTEKEKTFLIDTKERENDVEGSGLRESKLDNQIGIMEEPVESINLEKLGGDGDRFEGEKEKRELNVAPADSDFDSVEYGICHYYSTDESDHHGSMGQDKKEIESDLQKIIDVNNEQTGGKNDEKEKAISTVKMENENEIQGDDLHESKLVNQLDNKIGITEEPVESMNLEKLGGDEGPLDEDIAEQPSPSTQTFSINDITVQKFAEFTFEEMKQCLGLREVAEKNFSDLLQGMPLDFNDEKIKGIFKDYAVHSFGMRSQKNIP